MTDKTAVEALREECKTRVLNLWRAVPDAALNTLCNSILDDIDRLASLAVSPEPQALTDELILAIGRRALDKCTGTDAQHIYIGREVERALGHPVSAVPPLSDAARQEQSLGAPASPSGSAGSAPSPCGSRPSAPILGAGFVGMRAQAFDRGECKPITIMTDPQRAADGSWQVLVLFDERPGYLTPLGINYLWLKEPS